MRKVGVVVNKSVGGKVRSRDRTALCSGVDCGMLSVVDIWRRKARSLKSAQSASFDNAALNGRSASSIHCHDCSFRRSVVIEATTLSLCTCSSSCSTSPTRSVSCSCSTLCSVLRTTRTASTSSMLLSTEQTGLRRRCFLASLSVISGYGHPRTVGHFLP